MPGLSFALLISSRTNSQLELWRGVTFTEEFRARKSDHTQSFDEYLEPEERLFRELEDKVHAQLGTGPQTWANDSERLKAPAVNPVYSMSFLTYH